MSEKILKLTFFAAIALNIVLACGFVLHKDIVFTSEIARDFFLLDELDHKKIVLIGPSSTTGLFHGPLWTYINYPAYLLGNGNPVIVGWGWIIMIIAFTVSGFFIARKLFDRKTAYYFTLMISIYSVFHAGGMYNPHGAMFLLPAFFFFFMQYRETLKLKYLIIHILIAGALIQFQMAIGVPFLLLSIFYGVYIAVKENKKKHIFTYLLILVTVSNFIMFDLRHEFILSKVAFKFLTSAARDKPDPFAMIYQRVRLMSTGVEIIRNDPGYRNLATFLIFVAFLAIQIKDKKYKRTYLSFLYFYLGYYLLSNLNAGGVLYFYFFPIFPFVFLIFSSFITSRFSRIFAAVFFFIYFLNLTNAFNDMSLASKQLIGKGEESWLFLNNLGTKIFKEEKDEFGYFVYSPDIVAHRGKYAMQYVSKFYPNRAAYFQKKVLTYLIIAPPAKNNPYMKHEWWKVNLLHIDKKPESLEEFSNGYKLEKYILTADEVKVAVEPGIDPGIHFR